MPAWTYARSAARRAYSAFPHVRVESEGDSVDQPMPSTHTGSGQRDLARGSAARTTTTAPSAVRGQSSSRRGSATRAEASTSPGVMVWA